MVDHQRGRRLLGNDLEALGQAYADSALGVEQAERNLMLREIGASSITPRVTLSSLGIQSKFAANTSMAPLRQRLRRLNREPVKKVRFAELAARLQRFDLLGDLCADGDDYYAVAEDGEVVLWADGELTEETWDSVWTWARDVWLDT